MAICINFPSVPPLPAYTTYPATALVAAREASEHLHLACACRISQEISVLPQKINRPWLFTVTENQKKKKGIESGITYFSAKRLKNNNIWIVVHLSTTK